MWDWIAMIRAKWAKHIVLAMVLADCIGIYYANRHLNQPGLDPAEGIAVEMASAPPAVPADRREAPSAANSALAALAPARPDSLLALPAYMPLPPSVSNPLPAYAEPAGEFVIRDDFDRPRMARLQRSSTASRRFVSAFAADTAQAPAEQTAWPVPAFGERHGAATGAEYGAELATVDSDEPGASDTSPAAPAEGAALAPLPEVLVPAPVSELPPASEAPAAGADAGTAPEG